MGTDKERGNVKTRFKRGHFQSLKHGCFSDKIGLPPDKQRYLDTAAAVMVENCGQLGDLVLCQRALSKLRKLLKLDAFEELNPDNYEYPHDTYKISLENSFRTDLQHLILTPKTKRELGLDKQGKDFFSWLNTKQLKGKGNDNKQDQAT